VRTPNPAVLHHRAHINIAALALLALGLMTVFDPRLQTAGAATLFFTVVGWLHLRSKIRPQVTDYTEYLETLADEEGCGEWLRSANRRFMDLWQIEKLEEVGEGV